MRAGRSTHAERAPATRPCRSGRPRSCARQSGGRTSSPGARHATVPFGAVVLVCAQVGVVYVFAGLAKLHTDWLLHGLPLRMWLPAHADLAIIGPWLAEPRVAIALSWAGAAFDLLVVPAL